MNLSKELWGEGNIASETELIPGNKVSHNNNEMQQIRLDEFLSKSPCECLDSNPSWSYHVPIKATALPLD